MDIQLAILAVQIVWGLALFFIGLYLKGIKEDISTCVVDTKDCSNSIHTLARAQAVTDNTLNQLVDRVDGISKRSHDISERITVLETRHKVAVGHD